MTHKRELSRRAGGRFQDLITKTLRETVRTTGAGWSYRITDRLTYDFRRQGVIKHSTPHDHIFIHPVINLLVECKVVYEGDRFLLTRVKPDQYEELTRFTDAGQNNLGVVFYSYFEYRKRSSNLFVLPIWEIGQRPLHIKRGQEMGRVLDPGIRPGEALPLDFLKKLGEIRDAEHSLHQLQKPKGVNKQLDVRSKR